MNKHPVSKKKANYTISERFIDQLYNMNVDFVDEKGKKLEIPESGFLGLLATGYKGLVVHRKKTGHTKVYYKFTKGKKLVRRKPKPQNQN